MPNSPMMNVNQLQLYLSEFVKKLVDVSVSIPITILAKLISFQIKAWTLPVVFVLGGVKQVMELTTDDEPEPEMPSSDEIVSNVRRLQNSVLMGIRSLHLSIDNPDSIDVTDDKCPIDPDCKICLPRNAVETVPDKTLTAIPNEGDPNEVERPLSPRILVSEGNGDESDGVAEMSTSEFFGDDFMWDVPVLAKKAKYLAECIEKEDLEKIAAARRELQEYPVNLPKPQSREEYEEIANVYNFQGTSDALTMTHTFYGGASDDFTMSSNVYGGASDYFAASRNVYGGDSGKPKSKKKVVFREDCNLKPVPSKETEVNILKVCVCLVKIISGLNCKIDKFLSVAVNRNDELDTAKSLLSDVEADRNEMKCKLAVLEKLIKEEQEYLDDISGESGYDEMEHSPEDI